MRRRGFNSLLCCSGRREKQSGSGLPLQATNALILTDDGDFARMLTACWQMERNLPGLSVVTGELWKSGGSVSPDLMVIGPLKEARLVDVLGKSAPSTAIILCAPSDAN